MIFLLRCFTNSVNDVDEKRVSEMIEKTALSKTFHSSFNSHRQLKSMTIEIS